MSRLALLFLLALSARSAAAQQLLDLNPGAAGSSPLSPYVSAPEPGRRFFAAADGAHGRELWVTDGTAEGTRLVADVRPGTASSNPADFGVVGGRLAFLTNADGSGGLWVTDGTPGGTTELLAQRGRGVGVVGGWYYYVTFPSGGPARIYRTDGVALDEVSGPDGVAGTPVGLTSTHLFTSDVVFSGTDSYNEVYATQLTTGTTTALLGPTTSGQWSAMLIAGIRKFAVAHDRLYFAASDDLTPDVNDLDVHVFVTDGTQGGTTSVFDVPGPNNVSLNVELTTAAGTLYLATSTGGLWRIPALGAAPTLVGGTALRSVYPFGSRAITTVNTGGPNSIALLDGGTLTVLVPGATALDFVAVSDDAGFFTGPPSGAGVNALWFTDGTAAGTFPVAPPAGPARAAGAPLVLGAADGSVLYRSEAARVENGTTTQLGVEPWIGLVPDAVVALPIVPAPGPTPYDGGETGADVTLVDVTSNPTYEGGIVHYAGGYSVSGRGDARALGERWTLNVPGVTFGATSLFKVDLAALAPGFPDPTTLSLLYQPLAAGSGASSPEPVALTTTYDAATQTLTATGFTASGHFTLATDAPVAVAPGAEAAGLALTALPNPARGATTLALTLPEAGPVTVAVYDALGRRVATLVDGPLGAGAHAFPFSTAALPSGVYVARVTAGDRAVTYRLTVVR